MYQSPKICDPKYILTYVENPFNWIWLTFFSSQWDFFVTLLSSITKFDFNYSFSDGFKLFCPCGHVALIKCADCSNRGNCSQKCLDSDCINHKILCLPKLLPPINPQKNTFMGWSYRQSKKQPNGVSFWSSSIFLDVYFSKFPLDVTCCLKTGL